MKKLLLLFMLFFIATTAFAKTHTKAARQLSINIVFSYQQYNKHHHLVHYKLKNKIRISAKNHQWMLVPNTHSAFSPDQFILLSRIESANSKRIVMRFLIINSGKNSSVVSNPKMILRYRHTGQIVLKRKNHKLKLAVFISK